MSITSEILAGEGGGNLIKTEIANEIWTNAFDGSIVSNLATTQPITMGRDIIPVQTGRPAAHILGEGDVKQASTIEFGSKVIDPMKAQVQVRLSEEFIRANPVGAMDYLKAELAKAITRQIDLAVIHGRNANTGDAITRVNITPIASTENQATIPSDRALIEDAILDGEELLTLSGDGYYSTGWAFSPLGVSRLSRAHNAQGVRAFPELTGNASGVTAFRGSKAAVAPVVSGRVDGSADTGIVAIGGDWDALRLGYNSAVEFRVYDSGDPDQSGRDLAAYNEIMYRAEVFFGFAVMDPNAFVVYKSADFVEPEEDPEEEG